jgi:NADH-quinone oxidoreductase subunit D
MAMDVGALTVFLWAFREREKILDILDILTGVRFTTSYTRVLGLELDITDESIRMIKAYLDEFEQNLKECRNLIERNRIFVNRCDGVGVVSKEDAISIGLTGPNLRASGVQRDLRRDEPYLVYNDLDFEIPVLHDGDCLARYYVRIREMEESAKILVQCSEKLPAGPIDLNNTKQVLPHKEKIYTKMEGLINDFMLINFGNIPEAGTESYSAIESSKGELGFYIISSGTGYPFRLKIRSPSFVNIQALPIMMKGCLISDVVAIIGSIDPVMGEADK